MTKKHYEGIAQVIRRAHDDAGAHEDSEVRFAAEAAVSSVAVKLADLFEQDNPRFDFERFINACGTA